MHLNELKRKSTHELAELAESLGVEGASAQRRQELVFAILKAQGDRRGDLLADGVIEVLPDGFGFLRAPDQNYQPGADDIYVSPSQIRRFALRTGDTVAGQIRPPKESERYFALLRVDAVNGETPDTRRHKALFDNLTPIYPTRRIQLERPASAGGTLGARLIDLFVPLGFGQRCLLVAPPRAGATALLEELARGVAENHPDACVMVLLVDERPEDVSSMRRNVERPDRGPGPGSNGGRALAEVVSSTFDEPASRHVQVAELVIERAKRVAESGRDAVILVDSLTRLAAAYGAVTDRAPEGSRAPPTSSRPGPGGLDHNAIHKVKRFVGAARCLEEGGSLTIIAIAQTGSGSRLDELVAEELRPTATAEIRLDPWLADKRIFPTLDVLRSSTRRDDLLTSADERAVVTALRRELAGQDPEEVAAKVRAEVERHESNAALVARRAA